VPPLWAAAIVGLSVIGLSIWIGALVLELASISKEPESGLRTAPFAEAELVRTADELAVEVHGTPGAVVVLIVDGVPIRLLTLDDEGRASATDLGIAAQAAIEIAALAEPPTLVPTPTGSAPAETPATTSTPTITATPSSTVKPIVTANPTRPAEATARPTRRPTRTAGGLRRDTAPTARPPVLHLVTDAGPRIAVTFDGNASSNGTAELLDLLEELDLEITLFLTGGFIERYPVLVRRAVLSGHEVGNHTFSHPHLTTYADNHRHALLPRVDKEWFHDQLERTERAFRKATGRSMAPLWRAPYGEENSTLRGWAMELGYLHVRWSSVEGASLDARDWVADEHSKLYQDSNRMMDRLLNFPRLEGGIVLMHLATERSEPPWTDLPRFVRELERRNVRPVKVSDLLRASKTWRTWLEKAQSRHGEVHSEE
jgi:peptidoglycan/xylan/chitin deacetylase (PgdA/CDA1 family)